MMISDRKAEGPDGSTAVCFVRSLYISRGFKDLTLPSTISCGGFTLSHCVREEHIYSSHSTPKRLTSTCMGVHGWLSVVVLISIVLLVGLYTAKACVSIIL
jgi:hypothetical protein